MSFEPSKPHASPANSTALQPNADWSVARSQLETILPQSLFLLVEKNSELSVFVQSVFCQYPQLAATALLWHVKHSDLEVSRDLTNLFEQFNRSDDEACETYLEQHEVEMSRQLRLFRRSHAAALAVLELADQISIESSCARISALADCLILATYQWCYRNLRVRFGWPEGQDRQPQNLLILAMGKLGGNELNFSSDIDLIFFYPQSGETQDGPRSLENERFFKRLSTQLIKLLDDVTDDGFVYRVDMRLRPYGDSGALAMSFAQAEDYYQEQGRDWERFAMLRARILSGSESEQKALSDIIRPFSFRRYLDYGVIESIRNMKAMIQREVRRKGLVGNIKLGAGGIREVEFMVQSLQLIQGGRDKHLQQPNTLKVLPLLVEAGLLPAAVAEDLGEAYRFLRRLEHCIQELAEKQTQQLPESKQEQSAICIAMKFENWNELLKKLEMLQAKVNNHFSELFGEERKKALTQDDFYQSLAEGHINAQQLQQRLQRECSVQPQQPKKVSLDLTLLDENQCQQFIDCLQAFVDDPSVNNLSSRGAKRLKTFFPALLATCLSTENPSVTLQRLLKVLNAILKRTAYLELLSENPPILQHLVDLAGSSPWIANRLAEYPVLFDELLYPNSLYKPLQTADLLAELQQNLLRVDPQDEEDLLDTLRAFKQTNELRVAAALLSQRLSISQVSRYLTQQAEVILQVTVTQCWQLLQQKYGVPQLLDSDSENYGFGIIGYGKLGGFELGFGSDLDLVFLYNQPVEQKTNGNRPIANSRFYTRLAQKIIHFLSTRTNLGLLYEVDMRLRPSGSSGLLVSHIDAYRDYQMDSAWTWEHQALVRARFVAGDQQLTQQFDAIRDEVLAKKRGHKKLKLDVIQMRQKMRAQLEVKKNGFIDLKQACGGLVDIEFLSQFCSLSYQGGEPLPHSTIEGLKLAERGKILSSEDARTLIKNYRVYRNELNEMALSETSTLVACDRFAENLNKVSSIWQKLLPD